MIPRFSHRLGAASSACFLMLIALAGAGGSEPVAPVADNATAARAQVASTPATFEAFRILVQRNIFNPKRVGRTVAVIEPPQDEVINLVGTMDSSKGLTAFFDSIDTKYRQATTVGGTIAQYAVTHIDRGGVELRQNDKTFSLKVGQQLRRPPGGEWKPQEIPVAVRSSSSAAAAATTPSIPADASETLKRLMEKRQQQLKQ